MLFPSCVIKLSFAPKGCYAFFPSFFWLHRLGCCWSYILVSGINIFRKGSLRCSAIIEMTPVSVAFFFLPFRARSWLFRFRSSSPLFGLLESYYFFNLYYCWLPSTTSPPSRLRAVTLSNKSIYKIQLKPVRCRLGCLLLWRFFCASRLRILMTPL